VYDRYKTSQTQEKKISSELKVIKKLKLKAKDEIFKSTY